MIIELTRHDILIFTTATYNSFYDYKTNILTKNLLIFYKVKYDNNTHRLTIKQL